MACALGRLQQAAWSWASAWAAQTPAIFVSFGLYLQWRLIWYMRVHHGCGPRLALCLPQGLPADGADLGLGGIAKMHGRVVCAHAAALPALHGAASSAAAAADRARPGL